MGSDMTQPNGAKKAKEKRRENNIRAGITDEMNSSRGDFSYQIYLVDVLESKTTLASCWITIDDIRLAVNVWKLR